MPRIADEGLEQRILDAAQGLWRAKGDKGLTLRGVARAAGTTTTTVYKRFRNKEDIRFALAGRVQKRIAEVISGSPSIEEAYRRYLRFAENHPREYKLLFGPAWIHVIGKGRPRPAKEWLQEQFAVRFGGRPEQYDLLFYAIFLLMHGTSSLLANAPRSQANLEAEENCIKVCDLLLKHVAIFRKK
jgi:AcrR family transcriptional regulator